MEIIKAVATVSLLSRQKNVSDPQIIQSGSSNIC